MMKKNSKILSVVVIIFFVGLLFFGENTDLFSLFGFTTLSMDKVSFSSNDPNLNKDAFLLTISQNGQGQSAKGTIPAEDIVTTDGVASNALSVDTKIEDYRCIYPITSTSDHLYDYTLFDSCGKLDIFCITNFERDCILKGSDYFVSESDTQLLCIQKTSFSNIGTILDASFDFKTTIDVTIGSSLTGTKEQLILTPKQTSAKSDDNLVFAAWTGNTVSGTDCPNADTNNVGVIRVGNEWRLVDELKLDFYRQTHRNALDICLISAKLQSDVIDCLVATNNAASGTVSEKTFIFEGVNAITDPDAANYNKIADGVLVFDLDNLLQFPQYTLIIDAETLGVHIPVGKPDIVAVSKDVSFTTGGFGQVDVTVENIGTALGSFAANIDCQTPLSYTGTVKLLSLQPDETDTVSFNIQGESNSDITRSCIVNVYDRNNPDNKDTVTVYVTISPIKICNVSDIRCFADIEKKCIGGTHWETTGTDNCVDEDEDDAVCQVDADCDDGDFFTLDRCEGLKVIVDTGIDKKCTHKDMTLPVIALMVFIFMFILVIIAIVAGKRK